jgi:hypothetical protein
MMHPDPAELLDLSRNELSPARAEEVRRHLAGCAACRRDYDALGAFRERLASWPDEPLPEDFAAAVLGRLPARPPEALPAARPALWRRWLARAALVGLVVGGTLIFQLTIWSPLPATANINATFTLTGTENAPFGQAIPDSVLVLLLYPDRRYGTPLLEGTWELGELIEQLKERPGTEHFSKVVLRAGQPGTSITVRQEDLDRLLEAFDIPEVTVEEGVHYVIGRDRFTARIPVRQGARIEPRVQLHVSPQAWSIRLDTLRSALVLKERVGERFNLQLRAVKDSLNHIQVEPYLVLHVDPRVAVSGVGIAEERDLILVVGGGDEITIEGAILDLEDLPVVLKLLKDPGREGGLRILIRNKEGGEEIPARIIELLKRAGLDYEIEPGGVIVIKK